MSTDAPICVLKRKLSERDLLVAVQSERLIKLAEMCRRMETEEEKVLPFYASSLTAEEQEDVEAAVAEAPSEKLAEVIQFSSEPKKINEHSVLTLATLTV